MEKSNGMQTQRRTVGRGLAEIGGTDVPQTESVSTAQAAYQIAAILESVEDRQVQNVFAFFQAIRQTAKGETIQKIGEGLNRLERERRQRSNGKGRDCIPRAFKNLFGLCLECKFFLSYHFQEDRNR